MSTDQHLGSLYSVPVYRGNPGKFLERIEERLKERVFGQDRAIRHAIRILSRFIAGLNDPGRPLGVLLFAGPSGVGKTYCAKELGYAWIGDPNPRFGDPVVLISCENLQEQHEVMLLKGAPPSYIGYGDPSPFQEVGVYDLKKRAGQHFQKANEYLDEINRRNDGMLLRLQQMNILPQILDVFKQKIKNALSPIRGVVILDEIEKAHQNVRTMLLGILEEGKFRLNNGMVIDFTGTLFILTTNIGSAEISSMIEGGERRLGFALPLKERIQLSNDHNQQIWKRVKEILRKDKTHFPPELLGRLGDEGIVVFNLLGHKDYLRILDTELSRVQKVLSGLPDSPAAITLNYTDAFKDWLLEESVDPKFGARALRSTVEKHVLSELAFRAENGLVLSGDEILFDVASDENAKHETQKVRVEIRRKPRPKGIKLPPWQLRNPDEKSNIDVRRILRETFAEYGFPIPERPKPPTKPPQGESPKTKPQQQGDPPTQDLPGPDEEMPDSNGRNYNKENSTNNAPEKQTKS